MTCFRRVALITLLWKRMFEVSAETTADSKSTQDFAAYDVNGEALKFGHSGMETYSLHLSLLILSCRTPPCTVACKDNLYHLNVSFYKTIANSSAKFVH